MVVNFICTLGIAIVFSVFIVSESVKLQCMDEDNNPVDWFIIYKLPKEDAASAAKSDGTVDRGTKYLYMSSKSIRSVGWQSPKKVINDSSSIPGNTLSPLYRTGKSDEMWILYNDQPPKPARAVSGCGHTKGVVAANKEGGFWMIHSVPRFPETPAGMEYSYPESGMVNGQTFLCLTLGRSEMEKVAKQLMFNEAGVYYAFLSQSLDSIYPDLTSVAQKITPTLTASKSLLELKTVGRKRFKSFAKSQTFLKDIYEDFVAPELKVNLNVETWRNGPRALASDCKKQYSVYNIKAVKLCDKIACDRFTSTKDHSKWAASEKKENPWVCIGDINRAETQETRGGGTVCFNNLKVWDSFNNAVNELQPCSIPSPTPKAPRDDNENEIIPSVQLV